MMGLRRLQVYPKMSVFKDNVYNGVDRSDEDGFTK
jgi:hypothetical protein